MNITATVDFSTGISRDKGQIHTHVLFFSFIKPLSIHIGIKLKVKYWLHIKKNFSTSYKTPLSSDDPAALNCSC